MIENLLPTEIGLIHGFEKVVIAVKDLKDKSLGGVFKRFKDDLALGSNQTNLSVTVFGTNELVQLYEEVEPGTIYEIGIMHDAKGGDND